VFPGGRIDPQDSGAGGDEGAARRAASREAREEAGLEIDPEALVQISHWTTPKGPPKRFATWFFMGTAGATQVRVDGGEIHAHAWLTRRRAPRSGEIELPPPTFVTLSTLLAPPAWKRRSLGARRRSILPRVVRVAAGLLALSRRRGLTHLTVRPGPASDARVRLALGERELSDTRERALERLLEALADQLDLCSRS
jgi:ADP-ribose pyrophosphatase YjhB (NUDIX family)